MKPTTVFIGGVIVTLFGTYMSTRFGYGGMFLYYDLVTLAGLACMGWALVLGITRGGTDD